MNQILETPNNSKKESGSLNTIPVISDEKNHFITFLKGYFFISLLVLIFSSFYYLNKVYTMNKNEKISKQLINNYDISMLYSNSTSKEAIAVINNNDTFSIIGLMEIKKIDLKYPVISHTTDYLLEIAPCRFFGPLANESRKLVYCFS